MNTNTTSEASAATTPITITGRALTPYALPMVHLGGTSRGRLIQQRTMAAHAVEMAAKAVEMTAPLLKDFVLYEDATARLEVARIATAARLNTLGEIARQLMAEAEAIEKQ